MDADWVVPPVWLPEFRNILVKYVRQRRITIPDAVTLLRQAWKRIIPADREIPSAQIIELAVSTQSSAYDCEYVVLAQMLHLKLVSGDKALAGKFPGLVTALESFA
jgi:predicted nucleic acid-binding protein